jgi:hypothetical protein
MSGAIFLSASVPDPKQPNFVTAGDPVAIASAVSALAYVTLGRRLLVWGGHPAITPMIHVVAKDLDIDYGSWVRLYQSNYFKDDFPKDNEHFKNVVYTDAIADKNGVRDRLASLLHMRERMFKDQQFDAAVFIGGMQGVFDEFDLFRQLQPDARRVPVLSAGGAAQLLEKEVASPEVRADLADNLDYINLFHRYLGIPLNELRYKRQEEQPSGMEARLWTPESETIIVGAWAEAADAKNDSEPEADAAPGG